MKNLNKILSAYMVEHTRGEENLQQVVHQNFDRGSAYVRLTYEIDGVEHNEQVNAWDIINFLNTKNDTLRNCIFER
jgi:uncharacterized protein YxeA